MATPQIKAKLVLETAGGGLAGAATSGGTGKGLAGSMGFGKMAGAVSAGMAALDIIKKLVGKLVQSSPRLQATLDLLGKSIGLLLRPIGDTLSLFLRPFAIAMLRFAVPFYKKWYQSDFFKTAMEEGVTEAIKDQTIFGKEGLGSTGGLFRTEEGKPSPTVLGIIPATIDALKAGWEKISDVWDWVSEKIHNFFKETLPIAWDWASEKITTFLDETLPEIWDSVSGSIGTFFGETLPEVTKGLWDKFIEFWSVTFPEIVQKLWNLIKDFFLIKIPEWSTTAFNYLKDFFLVKVPAWIGEMANKASSLISNAISSVKSFFGFGDAETKKSKKVRDALITKTGQVIQMDPNDNLLAFKGSASQGAGSQNITINVNISAMDSTSFDSALISKITSQITENLKRGLQGRSSYGIGI